ncbi:MAG: hypothetical protein WC617_12935 [Rhodanobacter sp.]|jgi:hypothetical protein
MAKKTEAPIVVPSEKPSIEAFREAIQHVLMKEHGAPELVAKALLELEDAYVRRALDEDWGTEGNAFSLVLDVADEIAIAKPADEPRWIKVEKDTLSFKVNDQTGNYLDALVKLGLHGETRNEVAKAMMARGIESAFPLLTAKGLVTLR